MCGGEKVGQTKFQYFTTNGNNNNGGKFAFVNDLDGKKKCRFKIFWC